MLGGSSVVVLIVACGVSPVVAASRSLRMLSSSRSFAATSAFVACAAFFFAFFTAVATLDLDVPTDPFEWMDSLIAELFSVMPDPVEVKSYTPLGASD